MQSLLALLLVVLLALLAAQAWIRMSGRKGAGAVSAPLYTVREPLLPAEERAYLEILQQVLGEESIIFPKVSLAQILMFPGGGREHRIHWSRVQRRSVDFLVCDRELVPWLAIKFKPGRRSRKHRDDPLADSLDAANIPLLRVKPEKTYKRDDVAYRIKLAMSRHDSELSDQSSVTGEVEVSDEEFRDSRLSRLRRWTSDLWAATTRPG